MTKTTSTFLMLATTLAVVSVSGWAQSKIETQRVIELSVTKETPVMSYPATTFALPLSAHLKAISSSGQPPSTPSSIPSQYPPRVGSRLASGWRASPECKTPILSMPSREMATSTSSFPGLCNSITKSNYRPPRDRCCIKRPSSSTRVAHFRADGNFIDSFELTLPFTPNQLGEFASGDLLITGTDQSTREPRAALVNAGGEMIRSINLKERQNGKPASSSRASLPFSTFQVIPDGPDLLVFSPGKNTVFFATAGGATRALELRFPDTFELETAAPSNAQLIAELTKERKDGTGRDFVAYAIDPQSGIPNVKYYFPRDLGFGMACTDGTEFTFLVLDSESQPVKILQLSPSKRQSVKVPIRFPTS